MLDFTDIELCGTLTNPDKNNEELQVRRALIQGFTCCVKILDLKVSSQESIEALEHEILLLSQTKHCKYIVRYLHHERDEKYLKLYMEMLPNNLRMLLVSKSQNMDYFSIKQVKTICNSVLKALEFLHNSSIIHRNIKPDNILIEQDLNDEIIKVKLGDFGSGKMLGRKRAISSYKGTPGYSAPEAYSKTSLQTPAIDGIW